MTLKNQTAVIIGASQGIGQAIAETLAKAGMSIMLASRNISKLETLLRNLQKAYPSQTFLVQACDVQKASDVQSVIEAALNQLGHIDVLINNAGVAPKMSLLQEHSIEAIDRTIDTNLKGPMYAMHAVLPSMVARQSGTIVNINSIAGKTAFPFWSVYDASKFGLTALTEAVAEEQRTNGIRVLGIYPGAVDTPIWDAIDLQSQGRDRSGMLRPQDVADAVLYAASQPSQVFVSDITIMPTKPAL